MNRIIGIINKYFRTNYNKYPFPINKLFYKIFKTEESYNFKGWGMISNNAVPWEGNTDNKSFLQANEYIKTNFKFCKKNTCVDELLWRHWIITFAIRYAIEFTKEIDFELVECGSADGVSSFFVLSELKKNIELKKIKNYKMHLYDSWMPMRSKELLLSEYNSIGKYSDLDLERTKNNLSEFSNHVIYHPGYIPDSLYATQPSPESIIYLHIDLNSSKPTRYALEFLFHKIKSGGVILFDDYGWRGYEKTKETVDEFFRAKPGILFHLPTGQAIFFR